MLLAGIVVCFSARAAETVVADRLKQGRAVAQAYCSACHAIGPRDPSPVRANANTAFRDLHERYPIAMLVEALKTGRIEGHDEMPAFNLPMPAMMKLVAYIDSLSPAKAPRYIHSEPAKPKATR